MVTKEPTAQEVREAINDALIARQAIRDHHHKVAHEHPAAPAGGDQVGRDNG